MRAKSMRESITTRRCPICRGNKVCQCCKGTGMSPVIPNCICPLCYGNAKCWMCLGQGEIERTSEA